MVASCPKTNFDKARKYGIKHFPVFRYCDLRIVIDGLQLNDPIAAKRKLIPDDSPFLVYGRFRADPF